MRVSKSLRRDPGFPPRPQGRKRRTKKRQPKGRGACREEADTGKEPEGAGGAGQPPRKPGGSEVGEMPEGPREAASSEKRPRSRRGGGEARGQPAPSQQPCWGRLAAEQMQPQQGEGSLRLAPAWAAWQGSGEATPTIHNSGNTKNTRGSWLWANFRGGISLDAQGSPVGHVPLGPPLESRGH